MRLRKPSVGEVLYCLLLIFVLCVVFTRNPPPPSSSVGFQQVKAEFNRIKVLEGAEEFSKFSIDKGDRACYSRDYTSQMNQDDILKYYNDEAMNYGWSYAYKQNETLLFSGTITGVSFYYNKRNEDDKLLTLSIYFPNKNFFPDEKILYNFSIMVDVGYKK